MKDVAILLNAMHAVGVIADYALFGAAAQMRYTEAVATLDADVLVAVPGPDRRDVLSPICDFCRSRGDQPEGEAIRVGAWPVQFIPVFDELTKAALAAAETADFDGEPFRVVDASLDSPRARYLDRQGSRERTGGVERPRGVWRTGDRGVPH